MMHVIMKSGFWIVVAYCVITMLLGCVGAQSTLRPDIVETKTVTNTVSVPVPVRCFDPADIPALPEPTAVDVQKATTDQLASARARDAEAFQRYSETVQKLFAQCTIREGTK